MQHSTPSELHSKLFLYFFTFAFALVGLLGTVTVLAGHRRNAVDVRATVLLFFVTLLGDLQNRKRKIELALGRERSLQVVRSGLI